MDPEDFRTAGHALIDWIADFRAGIEQHPVRAQVAPGDVRSAFDPVAPTTTVGIDDLLATMDSVVVPGMTHVQHPMFFGWFPANASLASVLGDLASSGLGGLGISWESAPALTEVEQVVCEWMRQLTGLSDQWHGTIHDTASTSAVTALLVARERATDLSQNRDGLAGVDRPLVVYTTTQAHSSVAKAALLAGYGWDNIRNVDIDPLTSAMLPDALAAAMAEDLAAGKIPAVVIAGVGTTGVTAFDPVAEIVEVAEAHRFPGNDGGTHRAWVHVDAAMAGSGMLLPELRHLWDGVEGADSITWNPHKWMGTILDTSLFWVRDVEMLNRVMSTNPSYLQSPDDDTAVQYRDWGIPLGRRFRAMKLWFHLSIDGVASIQERLRRDLDNARWLADQVEAADDWELASPLTLQTVCVVHRPVGLDGDELDVHTLRWVRAINDSGTAFASPSVQQGRWIVRVSIGSLRTERHHVEAMWSLMQREAAASVG
ncbi:MAG: pyridoxal-dependent decarboxylase [Acidimicrobiales bacterium]